jgi:hypothetical protein
MNWYESERIMHEHVLRIERSAARYPHVAHLLERENTRRRFSHILVTFGGLLVTWGNHLQERWAVEIPPCSGTQLTTNH